MQHFDSDLGVYGLPGDVTPWDIRFDPTRRAHLERETDDEFTIRVWAEPDLSDGLLVVRTNGQVVGKAMLPVSSGRRFNFWQTTLGSSTGPVEYSFAFRSPTGAPVYRVPAGITNAVERLDRWVLDRSLEPFTTPEWAHGAVIYQIFPDRFANGNKTTDPSGVMRWDSPPTPRGFWGGDLVGVRQKLDYLDDLGIDLIYLNPIFRSPSNHRYDAVDYYEIDPVLGTNSDLRDLIGAAHERGIRVMIDASFNHVHPGFFAFQDLVANGSDSKYADWFVVNDWPVHVKYRPDKLTGRSDEWLTVWQAETGVPIEAVSDGDGPAIEPGYDSWYGVPTMPRVNLANPDARRYMLDVARFWIEEFDLDGWRMDVARYVDPDFWNDFRTEVKAVNPDTLLLAEVMGDASPWLQGDRFDATMNYTFRDICLGFFARQQVDGPEFLDHLGTMLAQYGHASTICNQNLIGSHDTARFLTEASLERWRLDLATICQLTVPGAPSIYYGDEIGMTGANDPGCRATFPWDSNPGADETYRLIRDLTRLRRTHPALRTGTWHPGPSGDEIISYERRRGDDHLLVIINRGSTEGRITHQGWSTPLWGDAVISTSTISVPPRRAAIVTR